MGRESGWLALATARSVDRLYVPESPVSLETAVGSILETVHARGRAMVTVAEGVRFDVPTDETEPDAFGHTHCSSPAKLLQQALAERGLRARVDNFGTLQRCASHVASDRDRWEAYQLGVKGVELALSERYSGAMPTLAEAGLGEPIALHEVANKVRTVPPEFLGADHVTMEGHQYLEPLLGDLPIDASLL